MKGGLGMIKSTLNSRKTLILLSVLSVIFGISMCFVTELCLPFAAATLAVLYLYDLSSSKVLSTVISVSVVAINLAATILLGGYSAVTALGAVLLAGITGICYSKNISKCATVLYSTIAATAIIVLSFVSIPIIIEGTFSLEVIGEFYTALYDSLEQSFLMMVDQIYSSVSASDAVINMTPEDFEAVFERAAYMLISIGIIAGFAISGITLKIFSAFVSRIDSDPQRVTTWRFEMPVLYAYFFMALSLINLFASSSMSIFAISMNNLYNVFLFVYAYIGLRVAHDHFAAKRGKIGVTLIMLVIIFLAFSLSIQILALVGVFYSIYRNRIQKFGGN
jgi:uncharacterized protein